MLTATRVLDAQAQELSRTREVEAAAHRLADAVAEFDAALDEGRPMYALVKLDQEVVAATRRHRAALARLAPTA